MKPSQPNVEYCTEHREFVNSLLEKRGGGEPEDRIIQTKEGRGVWLPSEGDVLAMLRTELPRLGEGDYGWALEGANDADTYQAWIPRYVDEGTGYEDEDIYLTDWLPTPLIALLELLRAVEDV